MSRALLYGSGLLVLAVFLMSSAALAQPSSDTPLDNISPEKLKKVAKAASDIKDIRQKYDKKLDNTYNQQEARSVRLQMLLEIDRTVAKVEGLSHKQYREITKAARSNKDLRERIRALAAKQADG